MNVGEEKGDITWEDYPEYIWKYTFQVISIQFEEHPIIRLVYFALYTELGAYLFP